MSRLLVDELITELFQVIQPVDNVRTRAVYLGLFVSRAPGGDVKLEIRDTNDRLIKASNTVSVSSLSTLDFAHGLFRFDIDTPLKSGVTYRFVLVPGGGYSFSSTDFVGWKRDFDHTVDALRRVPKSYTSANGYNAPYDYLIVAKKTIRKGVQ